MKKTMTKIFALVLVLAMVIGFVAMIPARAAEIDSVVVAYHNVYFEDYLQIMYAVYVPDGTTIESIKLSDGTNEFAAEPYSDDKPIPQYNGKDCQLYVAATGVSLQNIDTVVTAEIYVDGAVAATDTYSVLEYLHKRLIVDDLTGLDAEKAMYESLLDTAEKMQTVINGGVTLHDTSYVHVTNGTIDGINADGMVTVGQTLSGVTCDLIPGENQEVVWTVTEYVDGVAGAPAEKSTEQVQAIVVDEKTNLTLAAELKDIGAEDPAVIEDGQYAIVANGTAAMSAELDNNKLPGITVKITDGVATGSGVPLWTVTNVDGGVTLSYNSQYLAHTSASSTNLSFQEDAYTWTVVEGENGEIYLDSTAGGTTARGLMYRDGTNNIFGAYATSNDGTSGYHRAMLFCAFEECAHANTATQNAAEATCGDEGYTGDTVCNDCGATIAEGQVIEATGEHTFTDGTCSVCGAADPDFGGGETGTPITASKTVAELITEYGWTDSTTKQEFKLDDNVTVKINGGSNSGKAYNGDHIRIYATDSPAGSMTISVPEGYELVSVNITAKTGTYAYFYLDGTTTSVCNNDVAVSGTSVLINSVKNGSSGKQVQVTAIEVVYKATAAASSLCVNEIATPVSCKEWF